MSSLEAAKQAPSLTLGVLKTYLSLETEAQKSQYLNIIDLPPSFLSDCDPALIKAAKESLSQESEHHDYSDHLQHQPILPNWIETVKRKGYHGYWGFVGYRAFGSGDDEWKKVRDKLERLAKLALEVPGGKPSDDPENVKFGATIEWQEGVFNGIEDVRGNFKTISTHHEPDQAPRNALKQGIVIYACIMVDSESASSILNSSYEALSISDTDTDDEPFVWVIDALWPDEDMGTNQSIKVATE